MLNLLRFAEGGRELYAQALQGGIMARHGARVIYAGDGHDALVTETGQAWDAVLIVAYPAWKRSARWSQTSNTSRVAHVRTEALSEAVLQPTCAWSRIAGEPLPHVGLTLTCR